MKCHSQQQTDTAIYLAQLLKKIKSGMLYGKETDFMLTVFELSSVF